MDSTLCTVAEAAALLRLSPKAVGMWKARGWRNSEGQKQKLIVHGVRDGSALVAWHEVLLAERDTRQKRNRCHRGKVVPRRQVFA